MTNNLTDAAIVQSTIAGLEDHIFKLEEANKLNLQIIAERDARICEQDAVIEASGPLKAQVKALKESVYQYAIDANDEWGTGLIEDICLPDSYTNTPDQCLAKIKHDAIIEAAQITGKSGTIGGCAQLICESVDLVRHANNLLTQKESK